MTTTSWADRRRLLIDLETYSSVDIGKAGAFKYVEAEDFEILLLAYAWDEEPVRVIDLISMDSEMRKIGPVLTPEFLEYHAVCEGLRDPDVVKVAHNCAFERACLTKHLGRDMPPEEWEDTMILAAYNGLPMSLDAAGDALHLERQKLREGTQLINYFCKPCKPTVANGGRTRNLPEHAPDKWERFKAYCLRDVEAEQEIYYRLRSYPVTEFERQVFCLDARINEGGVLVDRDLAEAAVAMDETHRETCLCVLEALTGLNNPNSVAQLKDWLSARGLTTDSLDKTALQELKAKAPDPTTRRVLELRQLLGKTSVKKYQAMLTAACADSRVRGMTQYYGAGRTGRWAGRIVQAQNLPQNHLDEIDKVRELVRSRDLGTLEMIFDSVPDVLSQLIRTALIAEDGKTLLVADYSAIEARVTAYLAGEQWRMDVFAGDGKIYEASYANAFNVPIESVKKGSPERQKGKIMELALGYGGGVGALKAFGADKMGLTDAELQELVTAWRTASPTIPRFWRNAEIAAKAAIRSPGVHKVVYKPGALQEFHRTQMGLSRGAYGEGASADDTDASSLERLNRQKVCVYWKDADALRCRLPSGRILSYWGAALEEDGSIRFMGQNQTTRKWEKTETWGGKLVENIVQAYARDCLATAMVRLDQAGYAIRFHVHDEIIAEMPEGSRWQDMAEIMSQPIDWAPGLLLRADGYCTPFYKKD